MIDVRLIRENPKAVKDNIKKKHQHDKLPLVDKVVKLDAEWRKLKYREDGLRRERNRISLKINELKKKGKGARAEIRKAKAIPSKIEKLQIKRKLIIFLFVFLALGILK